MPGFYTFGKGEARHDVYQLDFFTDHKAKADYLQLFMDAGWEYLGEMGSWQYFRKTALKGEVLEIFSDNKSKAKKYQRILLILVVLLPLYIATIENARQTILEAGILRFDVFQDTKDPTHFSLFEVYRDMAAREFHLQTAHFLAWKEVALQSFDRKGHGDEFIALFPAEDDW